MKTLICLLPLALLISCASTSEAEKRDDTPAPDAPYAPQDADAAPAEQTEAPTETPPAAEATPSPASREGIDMSEAYAAFNRGDYQAATIEFTEESEWHIPGGQLSVLKGASTIAKVWSNYAALDAKLSPVRVLELGEGVTVVQGIISGTHVGDFMGAPASQKPVGYSYAHVYWESEDGNDIVKVLAMSNPAIIAAQLGLSKMPAPAVPTGPTSMETVDTRGDDARLKAWDGFYADWNAGKGLNATLRAALADDVVTRRHYLGGASKGKAELAKGLTEYVAALTGATSDMTLRAAGDYVVGYGSHTATLSKDMGPMKATNKAVTWHEVFVAKYAGDKIVEMDVYLNPVQMTPAGQALGMKKP